MYQNKINILLQINDIYRSENSFSFLTLKQYRVLCKKFRFYKHVLNIIHIRLFALIEHSQLQLYNYIQ
ncbi:hypothetical protein pb186bvf_013450 [Paramecium bursaria]